MSKYRLGESLGGEEHRPAVACLTAAVAFCVWFTYGDPKYYLRNLSSQLSFTGDAVVDAELYRGLGNLLLIALVIVVIKLLFRQSLREYGLGIGQWRNAPILIAVTPLMVLLGYLAATMPEYQAVYPTTPGLAGRSMTVFLLHAGVLVTYYIAWELLFRGFLQGALVPRLGTSNAIAVQTLASTLSHLDRPTGELFGSILVGILWGLLAHRTKSIWPVVVHHLLLGLALDYWICFGVGT